MFVKILKNFRTEEGDFPTDIKCSCDRTTSVYLTPGYGYKICKGCLSEMIDILDKKILENVKESIRNK